MPHETIDVIRSGRDYALALQRRAQLAAMPASTANTNEIAALREAVEHWESVCGLPSAPANVPHPLAKVA